MASIRVLSIFTPSDHPRLAGESPHLWQDCTTEACPPRPNKDMGEGNTGEELPSFCLHIEPRCRSRK